MVNYLPPSRSLIAGSRPLPGRYFTSPEIFALEIERIFLDGWVCLGRLEQIPAPGDYCLQQIGTESLVFLRGSNGRPRAFYNVCRHRGARIVSQPYGRFKNCIQCPYHAWTYDLEGRLIGAPLMDEVKDFDKKEYPLLEASLAEWEGFLLVNLSANPVPFEVAFAPLIGKFARWTPPRLRAARRVEYRVNANWKLIVQNYSECYHCPPVHPELARKSPYRSGRNDLYSGPFLGGYMELNHEYGSLTMSGRACAPALEGISDDDLKRVYYYAIFPNLLLSLHPDYVMCHTLWPQSPGETHVVCEWLFDEQAMAQPGFDPEDAVAFWDMVNRQDWQVCELSQLGVGSRAYQPAPYSGSEGLLSAFDWQVLAALELPTKD